MSRASADLAWLVIACSLLAALAMRFRAIDRVADWSRAFETFNLNGVMALVFLLPVAAATLSSMGSMFAIPRRGYPRGGWSR